MEYIKEIELCLSGPGIIIYSEFATLKIAENENYLFSHYNAPEDVIKHIYEGSIVGFQMTSSGYYKLKIGYGFPNDEILNQFEYKIRLGIEVRDKKIYFKDVIELIGWSKGCPEEQTFEIENGFYTITVFTNIPELGIGEEQVIYIYFHKVNHMPKLKYNGVPTLCE